MKKVTSNSYLSQATVPSGASVAHFKQPNITLGSRPKKTFFSNLKKHLSRFCHWLANLELNAIDIAIAKAGSFLGRLVRGALLMVAVVYIAGPELLEDMPDTYWFISGLKVCVEFFFHQLRTLIEFIMHLLPF